ncbi:MAG: 3'-5' exonuclease [Nocardiopsaceae bacterium]|nr:3'-5' exonuclease [Nocardiopsaceae bacterium]
MDDVLDSRPADRRALRMGTLTRSRGGARTAPAARGLDFAVVDMETTGLHPDEGARVCEIAVVRMRGDGTVLREFSTLINPDAPMAGQEFHGIGASDVVGAPKAGEIVDDLVELFSGAVLAGHKLDFEERFLAAEFLPEGLPGGLPGLCTLRALRSQVDLERYSLPRASHALSGHWPTGQHTALGDARACAQLLAELLDNAPGELRYTGPAPVPMRRRPTAVRLKPRASSGGAPRFFPVRDAPARSLARWPHSWRPLELDPGLCGGGFGAEEREAALHAAEQRSLCRDALAATAALAGGLAATSAVRTMLRRLR